MSTGESPRRVPSLLVAELTHRCPLGCPYCCNPLALEQQDAELDTATWMRVFQEAAALGVKAVELSGGEPGARRDLPEIAASAREAGLHSRLVTSGVGITTRTIRDLWEAGLDHVQISIQDADAVAADRIADHRGAFARKCALAAEVKRLGLALTIDAVVHRANIENIAAMVELAVALKAERMEITPVRFYGWARKNREMLMPTPEQVRSAAAAVSDLKVRCRGRLEIAVAVSELEAACGSTPCAGAPGRAINVTPSGNVLPCRAAAVIPGFEFWSVRNHSLAEIWSGSPAFRHFRNGAVPPEADADIERHGVAPASCRCRAHLIVDHSRSVTAAERPDGRYAYRRMHVR